MRRAGRIAGNARQQSEAVWALAALFFAVVFIAVIALMGAKPPEGLVPTSPPATPAPAPIVISGHDTAGLQKQVDKLQEDADAAQAEVAAVRADAAASKASAAQAAKKLTTQVDQLKQKADAAEADAAAAQASAAQAAQKLTTQAESLSQAQGLLAAAQAKLAAELEKRQQAEADLASSQAKLEEAETSQQHLEEEIASWKKIGRKEGNTTSAEGVLKHFEAALAETQVSLTKARQAAASEAKQREAVQARLAEAKAELHEQGRALEAGRNASGSASEQLNAAQAQLASVDARQKKLAAQLSQAREGASDATAAAAEEVKQAQAQAANATATAAEEVKQALAEAASATAAAAAVSKGIVPGAKSTTASLLSHTLIVLLFGIAGVFSVLGPSTFVHVFLPVVASGVGGLMAAGCVTWFSSSMPADASLLDAMSALVNGNGGWFGYFLWIMLLTLGILRWVFNVECSLWDVVEEVNMGEGDPKGAPLLDNEA